MYDCIYFTDEENKRQWIHVTLLASHSRQMRMIELELKNSDPEAITF